MPRSLEGFAAPATQCSSPQLHLRVGWSVEAPVVAESGNQSPPDPSPCPPPCLGPQCGLRGCSGPGITSACISRLQFWNLEFESQSFLYRQVGSALGLQGVGVAPRVWAPVALLALGCRCGE